MRFAVICKILRGPVGNQQAIEYLKSRRKYYQLLDKTHLMSIVQFVEATGGEVLVTQHGAIT